ncbi:hypothetical protein PV327_001719 [Microctonus hyperodae]|uniref:BSD domain-containing protein n=1 Tax=Microctonus hyperodae TaxID=165561 RepID=A0AA39FE31_MICHY|nr:hypothetical protein PV327_001719 [Microctonus hyperodae]
MIEVKNNRWKRLIAELNKEQEAFIAGKPTEKGEAVAPWVGAPNEDALREECLALSTDRRNFVRAPPPGVEFDWDFEAIQPVAQATLALDPNLETMRFELVPKVISEENFWRNYFYRVSLLRQSHELNAMASQAESNPKDGHETGYTEEFPAQIGSSKDATKEIITTNVASNVESSLTNEFVSDSTRPSHKDISEVKEGMKKLRMKTSKEEEWEGELEAELKDFEIVPGEGKTKSTTSNVTTTGKEDWEEQMDELLGDEDLK